ncbi:hypothetical protein [Mucilaginibacter myungsuensis]|uniref:Uncharacterized protein n=1 Tax=Mucilaginibacter myungsuensis TaxID=649104 RepID=A0A929L1H8_9SPHI|nr:hypothetical protein [Mucilaginibacter myungsuensis]MBE9661531.1 hypothetical protein [Mucilaginibacter myungsuensis]MDN3597674.1 hypothetical protein [Mucilaginibacter myungsuensis]
MNHPHSTAKYTAGLLLLSLFFSDPSFAQTVTPAPADEGAGRHFTTAIESSLSMLVLGFGIITIFLEVYLIKTNKIDANNSIKFIILTLIITGTLFLITAGYDAQLTPVLGLLGTIAGYLLGKGEKEERVEK